MPDFRFVPPDGRALAAAALPGLAVVFAWLAGALVLLMIASRQLGAR
jgi:ABC-2 type transport system permease protein